MALNVDNKKSVLDDDASLYTKREEYQEKKSMLGRFNELHGEEKKQFFKDYMLKPLIIGGIVVLFLVYSIISTIVNRKTVTFNFAVVQDTYMDNEAMEAELNKLHDSWGLDKHHVVDYNLGYRINNNATNSTFLTQLEAGTIDAVIGRASELSMYGEYLRNFEEVLGEGSKLNKDSFYLMTYDKYNIINGEATKTTEYLGIYLKDTRYGKYIANEKLRDELILVMPANGEDKEQHQYIEKFFNQLFEE